MSCEACRELKRINNKEITRRRSRTKQRRIRRRETENQTKNGNRGKHRRYEGVENWRWTASKIKLLQPSRLFTSKSVFVSLFSKLRFRSEDQKKKFIKNATEQYYSHKADLLWYSSDILNHSAFAWWCAWCDRNLKSLV